MKNKPPKHHLLCLALIVSLSLAIGFILVKLTYQINYWPTDSRHLYIPAAKSLGQLPYISSIHEHNRFNSLHGKEVLVIGIQYFQLLLNDDLTLFPNVLLLIFCVCFSGVLIYLISQHFHGPPIAFITALIFLSCFWPYQYVLQGAHQPLVLLVFLLATACLILITNSLVAICLSGLFLGSMFFCSPTSPVYLPYYLGALLYFLKQRPIKNPLLTFIFFFIGFITIPIVINFPNPLENLSNYYSFIRDSQQNNNFTKPQIDFGAKFPSLSSRGAGLDWVLQYMFLIMPILFTSFIVSIVYLTKHSLKKPTYLIIIFLGLSTLLAVETIQVAQFGRNYFSWIIGILIAISFAMAHFKNTTYSQLLSQNKKTLFSLCIILLATHIAFNINLFKKDVYPSRMTTNSLYDWMKNNPSHKFYTYANHPYNINIIEHLNNPRDQKPINIEFVSSLKDVEDGYFIMPPVTGKTIWVNCQLPGFFADMELFKLVSSGSFLDYVLSDFPTLASSRIWPQEEEYCSYLDLHLHNITPRDRLLGKVYILDAKKLQDQWFSKNVQ